MGCLCRTHREEPLARAYELPKWRDPLPKSLAILALQTVLRIRVPETPPP